MNQSLDIVGSFIIGGIVVAALVGLTLHFSGKSQETKLSEISQRSVTETGSIIDDDFNKIGYRVESGNKILSISSSSIQFLADLDNDSVIDTVIYSTITQGNALYLKRRVAHQQSKEWTMPIKAFAVQGLDSIGNSTVTISNIRSILLSLTLENKSLSDTTQSYGAFWKRQFFPKNL